MAGPMPTLGTRCTSRNGLLDAVTSWNKAIEVEPTSDAADLAREKLASASKSRRDGVWEPATNLVQPRG